MPSPTRGPQIATGADGIATANIVDLAVTTAKIDNTAVTTAKIAGGAVTAAKVDTDVTIASGANAFTGDQSMGNNKLTNLAAPTNPNDGARLTDIQAAQAGPNLKGNARVRAQGNVVLAAPGANIDTIAMVVDQVFLAAEQAVSTEDGLYLYKGAATPAVRTANAQVGAFFRGAHVFILEGTDADTAYSCDNDEGSDVVGTDDLVFTIYSRLGFGEAPVALGAANAEGSSGKASRANHVHKRDTPITKFVTTESVINNDTVLTDTLDVDVLDPAGVIADLNGLIQDQGAGLDYILSGAGNKTVTWLADTGTAINMKTSDALRFHYPSQG